MDSRRAREGTEAREDLNVSPSWEDSPMGVFKRGSMLWLTFKDVDGKWKNKATGLREGQEKLAQAVYDEVIARVNAAKPAGAAGPMTVRDFAKVWLVDREKLDLDWRNDRSRLDTWILPKIGDLPIASVRTRHIIDLMTHVRTTPSDATGETVSGRTVYNVYSVVSALFRDAQLADKIEATPCVLDDRQLGPRTDKNPEWRDEAVFARGEVETIISHPDIPDDRRVVYALELLAGVRPGEAAALRWRHYDATVGPLGRLVVALAYNTRKNKTKSTKTDAVKHVPVHATLAAMLAEWRLSGWSAMMGREPELDDLIVPLPPAATARRRTRTGDPHRGHDYSGKRWREEDLVTLGWRHRRHYDMRATFITLALEDGADADIIESRVTHTKKSRRAFDGYIRGAQWEKTCAEVAKLRIVRRSGARVIALPRAAAAGGENGSAPYSAITVAVTSEDNDEKKWRRRESNAPK
jgi:integrase